MFGFVFVRVCYAGLVMFFHVFPAGLAGLSSLDAAWIA
jgi:hypothetical protein